MVAREVLGPDLCIQECNWPYRPEDNFGYESWYTAYTPTVVGLLENPSFPSPLLSQNTAMVSPYYSPIVGATPYPFCPTIQGNNTSGTPSSVVGCGEWLLQTPVSLEPTYINDLLDVNLFEPGPQDELEAEDPLPVISKEGNTSTKTKGKKEAKKAPQINSTSRPRTRATIKRKAAQSDLGHCSTAAKLPRVNRKASSDPSNLEASPSNRHDGQASTYRRSSHSKDSKNTHVRCEHANITASEEGPYEEQQSSRIITQDPSMLSSTVSSDVMVSSMEGVNNSTTSQSTCTTIASSVNLLDVSDDNQNFEVLSDYAAEIVVPATQDQELPQLDLQNDPLLLTA